MSFKGGGLFAVRPPVNMIVPLLRTSTGCEPLGPPLTLVTKPPAGTKMMGLPQPSSKIGLLKFPFAPAVKNN